MKKFHLCREFSWILWDGSGQCVHKSLSRCLLSLHSKLSYIMFWFYVWIVIILRSESVLFRRIWDPGISVVDTRVLEDCCRKNSWYFCDGRIDFNLILRGEERIVDGAIDLLIDLKDDVWGNYQRLRKRFLKYQQVDDEILKNQKIIFCVLLTLIDIDLMQQRFIKRIWDPGEISSGVNDCSMRRKRLWPNLTNSKREEMFRLFVYHWIPKRHYFWFLLSIIQNQLIFQHEPIKLLPESSSILISTRRQGSNSSPMISNVILLVNVMPSAFWNFIKKMIANKKYMKEGHNRFHLLAYKTSEGKLGYSPLLHRN